MDAGSNTLRLLVAVRGRDCRALSPVHGRRETTRLGTGLHAGDRLDPGAVTRSLEVLRSYAADCLHLGVTWVAGVATGALRDAADGAGFVERAARETGIRLTVVDQMTEALLTLGGASRVLGEGPDAALADIGGRSTEVVVRLSGGQPKVAGLPLGAVTLTEAFLRSERPSATQLARLRSHVEEVLEGLPGGLLPPAVPLAGTGGTFTTLAALDLGLTAYRRESIDGHRLPLARLDEIVAGLVARDAAGRARLPGMERGREDIIVAGGLAAVALLRRLGRDAVTVSDAGILEGAILAGLDGTFPVSPVGTDIQGFQR